MSPQHLPINLIVCFIIYLRNIDAPSGLSSPFVGRWGLTHLLSHTGAVVDFGFVMSQMAAVLSERDSENLSEDENMVVVIYTTSNLFLIQ